MVKTKKAIIYLTDTEWEIIKDVEKRNNEIDAIFYCKHNKGIEVTEKQLSQLLYHLVPKGTVLRDKLQRAGNNIFGWKE